MHGKIVFEDNDKNYLFRYPVDSDGILMHKYINALSKEHTFIRYQGETIGIEEEEKYLFSQLEKIKNHQLIQLNALHENKIIGIAQVELKDKTEGHEGVLGIALLNVLEARVLVKSFYNIFLMRRLII